ncbi:MAG: DUF4446 family protein [Dethiobacter sp.]|jgi:hypothetical protein|nr:DUF4446 family protein [Dethiobacter sp.]MBS3901908.1 DUF4446 family protein [Dethiobacter sp.]MBS3988820.1 DUF4446 family protein [Dethiobacter sp.]
MEESYQLYFFIAIAALLVICLVLYCKLSYLAKRYKAFMLGANGLSLETSLESLHTEIKAMDGEIVANRGRIQELAKVLDTATRGVGVVRFNAFQETGSDLSFAVAFLDAEKNGVVISSIYGREESRTYAKPLEGGQSAYHLGSEEQEAIRKASEALQPLFPDTGRKEKR